MKTNNEVKHAFICGYYASAGNLHTDGKSLISYRTIVAQRQENGKILKSSRWYSNTTAHHLSHIIADYEVPFIDRPTTEEHRRNYEYLMEVAHEYGRKAEKARKEECRRWYAEQARRATIQASAYEADYIVSLI